MSTIKIKRGDVDVNAEELNQHPAVRDYLAAMSVPTGFPRYCACLGPPFELRALAQQTGLNPCYCWLADLKRREAEAVPL